MPFRVQEPKDLCVANECGNFATGGCLRCGNPFCDEHIPPEDERCSSCEIVWLEVYAGHALGRWGGLSERLVKTAKWSAVTGVLGVLLTVASFIFVEPYTWWWISLPILGLPLAVVPIALLPITRGLERARDRWNNERCGFLAERNHNRILANNENVER